MEQTQDDLEGKMQKASLFTSAIGLGLMVSGFMYMLIGRASLSMPGPSALQPGVLKAGAPVPVALAVMSVGIVLLAL
jgi:hypothetical protein